MFVLVCRLVVAEGETEGESWLLGRFGFRASHRDAGSRSSPTTSSQGRQRLERTHRTD